MQTMTRRPSHPGGILARLYMKPLDLTVSGLAKDLGVSRKTLSSIVNEHSAVSVDMALRLSRRFDTTPELWLNLQQRHDLWKAVHTNTGWKQVPCPPDASLCPA